MDSSNDSCTSIGNGWVLALVIILFVLLIIFGSYAWSSNIVAFATNMASSYRSCQGRCG